MHTVKRGRDNAMGERMQLASASEQADDPTQTDCSCPTYSHCRLLANSTPEQIRFAALAKNSPLFSKPSNKKTNVVLG